MFSLVLFIISFYFDPWWTICTFHCSVHCKYGNTAFLEVQSQLSVLTPGQSSEVNILFYPRECKHYHEVIPFQINGLSIINVDILGQGAEIKVWSRFTQSTCFIEEVVLYFVNEGNMWPKGDGDEKHALGKGKFSPGKRNISYIHGLGWPWEQLLTLKLFHFTMF